MQQIDEYPVFGQFVAFASVNIDHTEFGIYIAGRNPHETFVFRRKVGPAKEPAKVTLGQFRAMSGKGSIIKRRAKRAV